MVPKPSHFCQAVCTKENMYGETLLDLECYLDCLSDIQHVADAGEDEPPI